LFLLLSFLESIKKGPIYLLKNQSGAARPQPGAAFTVHFANRRRNFPHHHCVLPGFPSGHASAPGNFLNCENPGKNFAGSQVRRYRVKCRF
jgi:hypothetical protein